MSRVFVFGSLNVDLSMQVPHIVKPGETQLVQAVSYLPGGKGLNQAVASARMGSMTYMVGSVGKDHLAKLLTESLSVESRLDLTHVNYVNDYSTGQAFVQVEQGGENAILVSAGANQTLTAESVSSALHELNSADIAVFQLETPIDAVKDCLRAAKQKHAFTILNAAPATSDSSVLDHVDLLVVNETESEALLGRPAQRTQYAEAIFNKFDCDVITTLGSAGAVIRTATTSAAVKPVPIEVVDTTGAGDAFVGGLAHALAKGFTITAATHFATALAAKVCTAHGAQGYTCTPQEVTETASKHFPA